VSQKSRSRPQVRVRGRSFIALSLVPEWPVQPWLAELDEQVRRSPAFFEGRPVVVDMSSLPQDAGAMADVVTALEARGIRLIGIEGVEPGWEGMVAWSGPPLLSGGRPLPEEKPAEPAPPPQEPVALLLDEPVRSGQSVVFPKGDVTVIGSVASGAEVIAGGSIHVYGALRGRAVAGAMGNPGARIFCTRLHAELLVIDGLYRTADDMGPALRGRAVQAWLQGDALMVTALD
jgi:septum site-determining protein MinC